MKHIKLFENFDNSDLKILTAMEFFETVHDPNDIDRKQQFEQDDQSYIIIAWDISGGDEDRHLKSWAPEIEMAKSMLKDPEVQVEEMAYNGNKCLYVQGIKK